MDAITLKELCEEISISMATGKNWIRLGKIAPEYTEKGIPYFSKEYVKSLKKDIQSGANGWLKSRRNKTYISGNGVYRAYVSDSCKSAGAIQELLQLLCEHNLMLDDGAIQVLVADCAVKLFAQRFPGDASFKEVSLLDFLEGRICFGTYDGLIKDLILHETQAKEWMEKYPELFRVSYIYEEREDVLGLLYISCKNLGSRKAMGAYYTPTKVVRALIEKLVEKNGTNKGILDPCCGTGNFLLQLTDEFSVENIHGNDIDCISVKIARLNMALRFKIQDVKLLYRNITNENYLAGEQEKQYDLIMGNPPWGYRFTEEEKEELQGHYACAKGKNIESYDVFLERALSNLKEGGALSFVLPEAILNVKSHMPVRQIIIEQSAIQYMEFLGNIFDKVQCPCLILQMQRTDKKISCKGMEIKEKDKRFVLQEEREVSAECFRFMMPDTEYRIVRKVYGLKNVVYLKNNGIFALGIVTGNNKKYISKEKTKENERIRKGSDLYPYQIKEGGNYIVFQPDVFQQVAPTKYYRAKEKLLYRFIGNRLVFAYDNEQTLSLNSCNILIPTIPGIEIKYVLAILNSRVAQFLFQKQFRSVKVLRHHIEQIPIPVVSQKVQKGIVSIVNKLLGDLPEQERIAIYEELDMQLIQLYGLTKEDYRVIKNVVD